jgi:hypothetical protein
MNFINDAHGCLRKENYKRAKYHGPSWQHEPGEMSCIVTTERIAVLPARYGWQITIGRDC